MSTDPPAELRERLARMHHPSPNGDDERADAATAPSADDLDWFLFRSFPDCDVPPETFAELIPVYEKALRAGAQFDYELLFVRALELSDDVGLRGVRRIARAAVERALAGGFDPPETIAALRLALRALPEDDPFLDDVLQRPELDAVRFHWTIDFVLDERGLAEYLALSYLRDDDPATKALLDRFPLPPARLETLGRFFEPDACRKRIEASWRAMTAAAEREALAELLAVRMPGFAPGKGTTASPGSEG